MAVETNESTEAIARTIGGHTAGGGTFRSNAITFHTDQMTGSTTGDTTSRSNTLIANHPLPPASRDCTPKTRLAFCLAATNHASGGQRHPNRSTA